MVFTKYNDNLPDWVRENIMMDCKYCGTLIVDNSDGPSGMTARYCPNPKCPGHMAYKMDKMAKTLEVKNFGPATALEYIKLNHCESHLDILSRWFGDTKPVKKLSDIAELACIEGYGETTGKKELNSYSNFREYFATARNVNPKLLANKEVLFKAESYFTVAQALSKKKLLVMSHGSFRRFNSRKEFFDEVNAAFGTMVQVIEVGERKTGVSYMIIDDGVPRDGRKYKTAVETGVPVVSPAEFVNILSGQVYM